MLLGGWCGGESADGGGEGAAAWGRGLVGSIGWVDGGERWCVPCREATFRIIIVVGLMVLRSVVVVVGATFEISRL